MFVNYREILKKLCVVEQMPDGIPIIYDRDWLPEGDLFMPSLIPCERAGTWWCNRGTNVMHNCPCVKCDGTGWLTP